MGGRRFTRRQTLAGLATVAAPTLWLPGCHGKARDPREQSAAAALVPSRGSEATIIAAITARDTTDGQGATLKRIFPSPALRNLDPFVLLDDFDVREPAGFPDHPHRGFEAFTYMIEGGFHHRDNLGNDSTIGAGGTQRFNSGRGARHSEMPATRGSNRGLQLWVNLPRAKKQMEPEYQGVAGDAMPITEADGARVHTIIGDTSPQRLHTDVEYLDVTLLADGRFFRTVPADASSLLYVLDGSVTVGEQVASRGQGLVVGEGELQVQGKRGARFAWLRGRPHHEPIRHRGPFVD